VTFLRLFAVFVTMVVKLLGKRPAFVFFMFFLLNDRGVLFLLTYDAECILLILIVRKDVMAHV
jgi:hypothetical protein